MTTGEQLKITLGLKDYKAVYITRIILPHPQRVNMVFYDSRRPDSLTKQRIKITPFIGMAYSGKDLKTNDYELPLMTPLTSIEKWNGELAHYIIIPVNVAYSFNVSKKDFSRLPEFVYNIKKFEKPSIIIGNKVLSELTLYDLKDKSNISSFTQKWVKDRNRTTGVGNKSIKLVDMFLDEAENSITFQFLAEATELNGKKPNKSLGDYGEYEGEKEEVSPTTFKIEKNPGKVYELQIKILKFFDWLKVFEGEEITSKELKDILKVSDVQVFSTSPSFNYQGFNYWLTQLDGSIYPQNIKPEVWNKIHGDGVAFLDKHLYSLLRSIDFFIPQMAQKLNSKLKSRNLI